MTNCSRCSQVKHFVYGPDGLCFGCFVQERKEQVLHPPREEVPKEEKSALIQMIKDKAETLNELIRKL